MVALSRRRFCQSIAGFAGMILLPSCTFQQREEQFVSAYTNPQGQHFVARFNHQAEVLAQVELPLRGHDMAVSLTEQGRVLVFSRRPGKYIFDVDLNRGHLNQIAQASDGRHFFGHGVFSSDGQQLFTTENDFDTQTGKVVVRDAHSLIVINEFDSGGMGPHQLAWLNDNQTLVIANGGIATHPDTPRKKLNLTTMAPNLTYMDSKTGKILQQLAPPDHQLSIRHLAVNQDNKVVIGMQFQGQNRDIHPLVFTQQGSEPIKACTAQVATWQKMNQYTASVSIDLAANIAAVSCPRGGFVSFWDLYQDRLVDEFLIRDCAGVSVTSSGFVLSNGKGTIQQVIPLSAKSALQFEALGHKWDNHMANWVS